MRPLAADPLAGMNDTERAYAALLTRQNVCGDILGWRPWPFRLRLADWNCMYTPDFLVVHSSHFEVIEVKGFRRAVGMTKFRVAASLLPWFKWRMVELKKKEWNTILEILP